MLFVDAWAVFAATIRAAKARRPDVRVVHRVDGSAVDYGRDGDADAMQARVNLFADLTVFQSEYSRFSVREKHRVISLDGPVIYNPVDVARFHPDGPRRELPGRLKIALAAWSTNRRKGTWKSISTPTSTRSWTSSSAAASNMSDRGRTSITWDGWIVRRWRSRCVRAICF